MPCVIQVTECSCPSPPSAVDWASSEIIDDCTQLIQPAD